MSFQPQQVAPPQTLIGEPQIFFVSSSGDGEYFVFILAARRFPQSRRQSGVSLDCFAKIKERNVIAAQSRVGKRSQQYLDFSLDFVFGCVC